MGEINPWLKERLEKTHSPETIDVILELEEPQVVEKIRALGHAPSEPVLNMVKVTIPLGAVDAVSKIPGVKKVSYNMPMHIRAIPSILDSLMGKVSLSAVEIPFGPGDLSKLYYAKGILSFPFNVGKALGFVSPFSNSQISDVIIVPTSDTAKLMGIPVDNRVNNVKVAILDTGAVWPHWLFRGSPIRLETLVVAPPLDGLGHGCVNPEAKIFTTFCGLAEISNLWAKVDEPICNTNVGETKYFKEDVYTLGLSAGKTVLSKVIAIHRIPIKAERKMNAKRITTELGTLLLTKWHPLFVRKCGDSNVSAERYWKNRGIEQDIIKTEARKVQARRNLVAPSLDLNLLAKWKFGLFSPNILYLAGLIKGDGTVVEGKGKYKGKYDVRIYDQDRTFLDKVRVIIESTVGASVYIATTKDTKCLTLGFANKKFVTSLKYITTELISKDIESIRAYLAGFFDAEGSVDERGRVRITNKEINFLTWVKELMASLGIPSVIQSIKDTKGHVCYQLYIFPRFTKDFLMLISNYSLHKDKLDAASNPIVKQQRKPFYKFSNVNLITVEKTGKARYHGYFYDFTTETGNYVANGIFVSNTWATGTAFGGKSKTRFGICQGMAEVKGSNILSVKVLNDFGFGEDFGIIKGIERAVSWGAKVINMSFGSTLQGTVLDDPVCVAIEKLKDKACFVAAGGNLGSSAWSIGSPGASPYVITVGSWSPYYDGLSIFSSRGPSGEFYRDHLELWENDLARYGENMIKPDTVSFGGGGVSESDKPDLIYSSCVGWADAMYDHTPFDGWGAFRGSSMAAPHVSGAIALLIEKGLIKNAGDVKRKLAEGVSKSSDYGYGIFKIERFS